MPIPGILFAALAAAAAGPDAGIRPSPRATVCQAVSVTSPDVPKVRQRFSARRILDLQFQVSLDHRLDGPHQLSFKVFTPNGHLYQELGVPFRAQGIVPKNKSRHASVVKARLPVAGTSITNSGLFGAWRVVPHLDGDPRPCGAATKFSITR